MTITDDISNDQSMAVAEILRADQCINTLETYKDKGFVLALIDDALFKSTSFMNGQDAAYKFVKNLAHYNHAITLVISHFPLLSTLEQTTNGIFKNYQTNIVSQDGKKSSTFSLKKGVCPQENIYDLIREQGYVTKF